MNPYKSSQKSPQNPPGTSSPTPQVPRSPPAHLHVPELDKGESSGFPRLAMLWHFDQLHLVRGRASLIIINHNKTILKDMNKDFVLKKKLYCREINGRWMVNVVNGI